MPFRSRSGDTCSDRVLTPLNAPAAAEAERTPSFRTDIAPLLSKAGCNMGACHGNLNGKGGFKLSLRGEDPVV